jgi:hypothetical protein
MATFKKPLSEANRGDENSNDSTLDNDNNNSNSCEKAMESGSTKSGSSRSRLTRQKSSHARCSSPNGDTSDAGASKSIKANKKKKGGTKSSSTKTNSIELSFHNIAQHIYNYKLHSNEEDFLDRLFVALTTLKDIWDRIGFNGKTQQERLTTFFQKMFVRISDIFVSIHRGKFGRNGKKFD